MLGSTNKVITLGLAAAFPVASTSCVQPDSLAQYTHAINSSAVFPRNLF